MTTPLPRPNPNQGTEKLWYYTDPANQSVGPVPFSELRRLAAANLVRSVDYVREKGTSEWVRFDSIQIPQHVPITTAKPRIMAVVFRKVRRASLVTKTAIGVGLILLFALALVPFIRGGKPVQGTAKTGNLLSSDKGTWRLIKAQARMYSDEKAFADAQTYSAQGRTVPLVRMAFEERLFSFPTMIKVEFVKQEAQMVRVRVYRAAQKHTFDLLALPDDLLPYEESAEKQALQDGEARNAKQVANRTERMQMKGQTVAIKPNSPVFVDIDALWEEIEDARDNKPGATEKIAAWIKSGKVFTAGTNSTGVVSGDGPYHQWVLIESKMAGKSVRFWAPREDIKVIVDDGRFRQSQKFRLGDYTYEIGECEVRSEVGPLQFGSVQTQPDASFLVVRYAIVNESNSTQTVMADDFLLRDVKGRQFRPSSRALTSFSMEEGENKDFILSELQPGVWKETATVFEIPNSALAGEIVLIVPEKGFRGSQSAEVLLKTN